MIAPNPFASHALLLRNFEQHVNALGELLILLPIVSE